MAWEEELLGECRILLSGISLQHNSTNQWWIDPISGYSVKGVYRMLTSQETVSSDATTNLIWQK